MTRVVLNHPINAPAGGGRVPKGSVSWFIARHVDVQKMLRTVATQGESRATFELKSGIRKREAKLDFEAEDYQDFKANGGSQDWDSASRVNVGHSRIRREKRDVDHYVILDDTASDGAAWAIEFGVGPHMYVNPRTEKMVFSPGMPAIAPLRKGMGIL